MHRRHQRDPDAGPQRLQSVLHFEPVVAQADVQVVRPQRHEACHHHDQHDRGDHRADHEREREAGPVTPGRARELQGLRALGDRRMVAPHDPFLRDRRQRRRHQQHHADHGPHLEIALPGHLVVDLRCQHAVVAADHHRIAEVGDHDREHDERRRQEPVLGRRQRDVAEDARAGGAQHLRGLVQASIRHRQRRRQDQIGVRKAVEHVGDDDSPETVDVDAEAEGPVDDAIAPEQEHDAERLHQRRREERQQRDRPEGSFQRHHRPAHRVGERVGEQHRNRRGGRRNGKAVADHLGKLRAVHVTDIVAQSDAVGGHEAHLEDAEQRQQHEHQQRHDHRHRQREHGDPVAIERRDPAGRGGGGGGHPVASCRR